MNWARRGQQLVIDPRCGASALARAFAVVSQRSTPHDRSELKVERPAQGAQPHLAMITHPFSWSCRNHGCSIFSETHGVDLIKKASVRGDHRRVAALLTGRARPQAREARRASRRAPTPSVVGPPGRRHTAARTARRARSRPDRDATGAANGPAARISARPTRGHPEIAPTPPTRARAATATDELPSTSKACIVVARQLSMNVPFVLLRRQPRHSASTNPPRPRPARPCICGPGRRPQ
jgi:hypothetical protein